MVCGRNLVQWLFCDPLVFSRWGPLAKFDRYARGLAIRWSVALDRSRLLKCAVGPSPQVSDTKPGAAHLRWEIRYSDLSRALVRLRAVLIR